MKSLLQDLIYNGTVVSLHFNKQEPNSAVVGIVESADAKYLLLTSISPEGFSDGYIARRMDSLYKIETAGKYETKIKKLYELRGSLTKSSPIALNNSSIVESILLFSKQHAEIIGFSSIDCDEYVFGTIREFGAELVQIEYVDEYGNKNGVGAFYKDELDMIEVGSLECKARQHLLTA